MTDDRINLYDLLEGYSGHGHARLLVLPMALWQPRPLPRYDLVTWIDTEMLKDWLRLMHLTEYAQHLACDHYTSGLTYIGVGLRVTEAVLVQAMETEPWHTALYNVITGDAQQPYMVPLEDETAITVPDPHDGHGVELTVTGDGVHWTCHPMDAPRCYTMTLDKEWIEQTLYEMSTGRIYTHTR